MDFYMYIRKFLEEQERQSPVSPESIEIPKGYAKNILIRFKRFYPSFVMRNGCPLPPNATRQLLDVRLGLDGPYLHAYTGGMVISEHKTISFQLYRLPVHNSRLRLKPLFLKSKDHILSRYVITFRIQDITEFFVADTESFYRGSVKCEEDNSGLEVTEYIY